MSVSKKKVMGLALALETGYVDKSGYGAVIDAASQLCTILKDTEISLSMSEKMTVLKSLSRAKVRAFMGGASDEYRTFKTLESISLDLVQLL